MCTRGSCTLARFLPVQPHHLVELSCLLLHFLRLMMPRFVAHPPRARPAPKRCLARSKYCASPALHAANLNMQVVKRELAAGMPLHELDQCFTPNQTEGLPSKKATKSGTHFGGLRLGMAVNFAMD